MSWCCGSAIDVARRGFEDEPPNHQIDFGVDDYGPYPFVALPREYDAAVEKFGVAIVRRHGLLPWRTMEEYGNLRRIFQGLTRNQLYVGGNTVLFASTLAHYIQDAHQPLHVHNNYDGQLSGQTGLHSRFESELFELRVAYDDQLRRRRGLSAARATSSSTWRCPASSWCRNTRSRPQCHRRQDTYGEYFEKFFTNIRPVLERQLAGRSRTLPAQLSAPGPRPASGVEFSPRPVQRSRA